MRISDITPEVLENVKPQVAPDANGELDVELPDGTRGKIDASMQEQAITDGLRIIPPEEIQREKEFAAAGDKPVLASAVAGLSGITLGLSDQIIKRTGMIGEQELKDLYDANPIATGVSEVAGTIAPAFFTGGASLGAKALAATPAALAELAGKKTATKLAGKFLSSTTSNVVKNAVKMGAGSAVEGSLYGVGKLISEDALGDAEFNAENALAAMGEGALIGGAFGGATGLGGEVIKKGIKQASEKTANALKGLIDNEIGFLKTAGAEKGHIKQILKKESLTTKDLNEYAMDIGAGFADSADDILANGGITQKGSKSFKEAVVTNLDDLDNNNIIAREGAGKLMGDALDRAEQEFQDKFAAGQLKKDNLVYGDDLANYVEKEFLDPNSKLYDPKSGEAKALVEKLRDINTLKDPVTGEIIERLPLSPSEIKQQSMIFAKEAGFGKLQPSRIQEINQSLWANLENRIDGILKNTSDPSLAEQYKKGKKLFEKSITLEKILESGRSKLANNRGLSLTEGLATVAGGSIGGLPGAAAGYALRKAQSEYGDKVASYVLRRIEQASNKGKIGISDAVDGFFKSFNSAGKVSNKAALRLMTGKDISEEKQEKIRNDIETFAVDPRLAVDNFVKNNQDMLETAPKTAQALQQRILNASQFLASKVPKQDDSPFKDTPVSRSEVHKFRNYVEAVENPYKVIENLKNGYVSPESLETLKAVYPKMFQEIRNEMINRLPEFKKISEKQKAELSKILGLEAKRAYTPQGFSVLQSVSAAGVQQNMQQMLPNQKKTNINLANRSQTGLDKTLSR